VIVPGPCSECGAPLDREQRYCINCGNRVAPPLALPYVPSPPGAAAAAGTAVVAAGAVAGTAAAAGTGTGTGIASWLPMPIQALTTFAALALGFGVVVGTALSPNLSNLIAAPQQVAQVPVAPAPAPAPAPSTGGGGGTPAPSPSPDSIASTGTSDSSGSSGGGGGGGGSKKKPKQKKPTYLNGTVIHTNPVAQSYTISSGGGLSAIHANGLPPIGKTVRVPVRSLENRTFAEDGKRQLKADAAQATFAGIVTDNRDSTDPLVPDTYTVSARGASVLVHSPPDATPTTVELPPAIGSLVTTTVEIRNLVPTPQPIDPSPDSPTCMPPPQGLPSPPVTFTKELHQTAIVVDPAPVAATEVETVIQRLCPSPSEFLLSSDDVREGRTDVLLTNGGIDISLLAPGQPAIGSVTIVDDPGAPGTKTLGALIGVAGDLGAEGADDPEGGQGALARVARISERRIERAFERAKKKRAARAAAR
jgi:hypothetical protein